MTERSSRKPLLAKCVHGARVAIVVALLLAIPSPVSRSRSSDLSQPPSMESLRRNHAFFRQAERQLQSDQDANGLWPVVGDDGETLALVARTLPDAADVVGYRGPTEASILLTPQLSIDSVGLLDSADTQEHVAAVVANEPFFQQFAGWTWGGPPPDSKVDAVSGATLTSMALAEGVLKRIGGARPSLVFPDPLSVDDVQDWFETATSVDDAGGEVRDAQGKTLGRVLRSGPLSDNLIGYQGPTELLMRLSTDGRVEAVRIRRSFDNEPYVDYVRTEAGFWKAFRGKSLEELSGFVSEDEGIEGVSGATMTSLAVADTIVAAAKAAHDASQVDPEPPAVWQTIRWTMADLATIVMLALAGLMSRFAWFHHRLWRRLWLTCVVAVIGLWSGNLISMALVAGWSAEGVAWRLAPGLSAIAAVTMLIPPLAKHNPYCNHLCPHGAVQQLIRPGAKSRRRVKLPRAATRWLSRLPGTTLVAAYLALLILPTVDLSSWEPFHAYLFRIAGWGSFALAMFSLAIAAVIPMGYCRLGCPTGRLIGHLRRTALSHRIGSADLVAVALLVLAIVIA